MRFELLVTVSKGTYCPRRYWSFVAGHLRGQILTNILDVWKTLYKMLIEDMRKPAYGMYVVLCIRLCITYCEVLEGLLQRFKLLFASSTVPDRWWPFCFRCHNCTSPEAQVGTPYSQRIALLASNSRACHCLNCGVSCFNEMTVFTFYVVGSIYCCFSLWLFAHHKVSGLDSSTTV